MPTTLPLGGALTRVLLVLAVFAACPSAVEAQRDPDLNWRTLDGPHFIVHYHIPLGRLARRVLATAERAHATVAEIVGYERQERTHIVLTDNTDSANGSATALPYNQIRLFAAAPSSMSPLGDYDDWLNLLVTHEHVHIAHLDQWSGLASFINAIFGKVYSPSQVQPRWVMEGLATWQESERTSGGRMRSSMFDMYLRMDALENRFFRLDQLSTIADRWPHGNVWYLYGSAFIAYMARTYGREAMARIIREYADETLPWGLNRTARRVVGRGWTELYQDFLEDRRAHYRAQLEAVTASGRVEGRRLTHHGEIARTPRFDRRGRVMYHRQDRRSRPRVQRFELEHPEAQETLARVSGLPGYDLHPGGRSLYFSRLDNHRDIYFFHDLFRRDLRSGRVERLTHGLRAREPDVSADGRWVTFVTTSAGTSHLMLAEARDVEGTARRVVESAPLEQVFNPRFSPDGQTIAFARWRAGGYRDIELFDRAAGEVIAVTHDRAQDQTPAWAPDGRALYFTSDRTGIANVYRYRLASGRMEQVTNVVAGAYQPAISPDGQHLVYVGYTSYGFDLFALELGASPARTAPAYIDRRPPPVSDVELWNGPSRDYQPLETLWPRSYLVGLGNDGFGPSLAVTVGGEDLARWHTWGLVASHGLVRGNLNFDAAYSFNRLPLRISGRFFRRISPRGGLRVEGENRTWIEEAIGGELQLGYRLPETFRSQNVTLAWRGTHLDNAEPFEGRLDPNDPPPTVPELGLRSELRLSWSYSDLERYGYDISDSNGRAMGFTVAVRDPLIGNPFSTVELTWFIRAFVPMPWLQHHVLAVHYAGGLTGGDAGRRPNFAIGGWPTSVTPLDGIVNNLILGGVALRGYPAFDRGGNHYHLLQLEYRFLLWRINAGVDTLPLYFNRLHGAVYADAGDAFLGRMDITSFRVGVGGHLMLDFTVGYQLPFTLRLGYARGLMTGGIDAFHAHFGVPF